MSAATVFPTSGAGVRERPLDQRRMRIEGCFWGRRIATNRERSIPHDADQLEAAGNLANFEAAIAGGEYRAGQDDTGLPYPFLDSDVHKWLEAAGRAPGRGAGGERRPHDRPRLYGGRSGPA